MGQQGQDFRIQGQQGQAYRIKGDIKDKITRYRDNKYKIIYMILQNVVDKYKCKYLEKYINRCIYLYLVQ